MNLKTIVSGVYKPRQESLCWAAPPMEVNACHTFTALNSKHTFPSQQDTKDNMGKMLIVRLSKPSKATCSLVNHSLSIFSQHSFLIEKYTLRLSCITERMFFQKRSYVNKNSASLNAFPFNKPLICLTPRPPPYTMECSYWGVFLSVKLVSFPPPTPGPTSSLIKPHAPPASASNPHDILINRTNM